MSIREAGLSMSINEIQNPPPSFHRNQVSLPLFTDEIEKMKILFSRKFFETTLFPTISKHERRKTPGRESSRYASHRIKTHARFPRREFLATRILPRIKSVFRLSESFADFRGSIVATTSGDTLTEIGSGLERFKSWSWRRKRASCPAGNFYQAFHVQQWTILSVSRIESSLVSLVSRIGNDNYSLTFIPFLLRISRERENTLRRLNTRHWI